VILGRRPNRRTVLPGLAVARKLVEASDLDVMELADDCW
jgi:hypothetical protein